MKIKITFSNNESVIVDSAYKNIYNFVNNSLKTRWLYFEDSKKAYNVSNIISVGEAKVCTPPNQQTHE